jgi:hypothetical protein
MPSSPPPRSPRTFPTDEPGADALPVVSRGDQIAAHDGARVRLIGTYVEIDARMAAIPPPRHIGHVAIRLADGAMVSLLPVWSADALRPEAEIAAFVDRAVEVIGVVWLRAPAEPHGGACPISPAITQVGALRPPR